MDSALQASPSPAIASPPGRRRRILGLLPIPYSDANGFWFRDVGLLVATLRAMGHDAHLVTLTKSDPGTTIEPVIPASVAELESPDWWKALAPDGVICCTWGASRYAGMRRAALAATPRLVEKLDTDGIRSPRTWFREYMMSNWTLLNDEGKYRWFRPLGLAHVLGRATALYCFPGLLDRPMAQWLAALPVLAAESPLAAERIREFIRMFCPVAPRVEVVPHPVDLRDLPFPGVGSRARRLVAVGRWNAHQKNFPLLLQTIRDFLAIRPEWEATILGGLPADLDRLTAQIPPEVRKRIAFPGPKPHAELGTYLNGARMLLVTSRHESFHIAAAEALCCGCTVVGPVEIATMPWFAGSDSGTVAVRRTRHFLGQALQVEAGLWESGERDPQRIATTWRARVGAQSVVERLLDLLFGGSP